ncbi:MAG TPA: Na+-dependent transporter, partial [Pseudolabrys sp.]
MNWLARPAAALSFISRKGTLVVAASIVVGLAVPPLAAAIKPYLGEAIVLMLTLAFLRVDPVELRHHFTRPGLITAATVWVVLIVPAVLGTLFLTVGLDRSMPGLFFMLVLQMSAPGLMSSP